MVQEAARCAEWCVLGNNLPLSLDTRGLGLRTELDSSGAGERQPRLDAAKGKHRVL